MAKYDKIFETKVHFQSRYIPDYKDLMKFVNFAKKNKKKIVLTEGVYDLIHQGHANYLEIAKSYGDILIVGVDTDKLTKLRKGPSRPIVPQEERLQMLSHLRHVDVVTLRYDNHHVDYLLELVQPDIFVVSETTKDMIKDKYKYMQKFCKKLVALPSQSTTTSSARIRNLTIEGAEELGNEVKKLVEDFLIKVRK